MDLVLGTLWKDLLLAAALGAVGGMGLSLLQEKGLEMPHWHTDTGVNFADLGFIADVLIGALAAVITREHASRAEMYRAAAADASKGVDVKNRLDELENADKVTIRRWGPR
jgi:hypothetical protein